METVAMFMSFLLGLAQSLAPTGAAAQVAPATGHDRIESAHIVAADPAPVNRSAGFVILGANRTVQGHEILRSRDGLFYVTAIVNGVAVRFVVDTGATVVVLTADDARRTGLAVNANDFSGQASTANGRAAMARVKLNDVVVGTRRDQAVDAAVVQGGLNVSLLGQSWLSRLQSVTITGDRMLLN
jgi:aspartyl protease family protein